MQIPVFLLASLMIFDGLVGPQLAPKNLATVGAWLHYRGLVVLALLVAGNLFCMACPFMLPRQAGWWLRKRLGGEGRPLPRLLRNKWLAIGLVVAFFFCYEYFSLWATPWWTAWVALAYFAAAFVVDTIFRGAAFCKYVCPLGQFNFFGSLVSPLEIKVRRPATCDACRTKDCIQPAQVRLSAEYSAVLRVSVVILTATRLRAVALPAAQDRQHGLHLLPGLHPRLPVRQRRADRPHPDLRAVDGPVSLRHRPLQPAG